MRDFWIFLRIELKQHSRDMAGLFWIYGFPVLLLIFIGLGFGSSFSAEPKISYLMDNNQSARTESLLQSIKQKRRLTPAHLPLTASLELVKKGRISFLLVFHEKAGEPNILLYYDPSNPMMSLLGSAIEKDIQEAAGQRPILSIEHRSTKSRILSYTDFLLPGIIGMNLLSVGIWGVGYVVMRYRKMLIFRKLKTTPASRVSFILSLITFRLVISMIMVFFLFLVGYFIFGVCIYGNMAVLLGVSLIGALAFLGIGLLCGVRTSSEDVVNGLGNAISIPLFIFSGVFFSRDHFPAWLQNLADYLPLSSLLDAMRKVVNEGEGLSAVFPELVSLVCWAIICLAIGIYLFQWE